MPDAQFVFLAPPSWEELGRRLADRATDGPAVIAARLARARIEMEAAEEVRRDRRQRRCPARCVRIGIVDGSCPPTVWGHDTPDQTTTKRRHCVWNCVRPEGITNPPIDELLERTQSKYALVIIAAKRARQINAYYSQLGEGLLEYVGPLVETAPQEKPLSIALREVNARPDRVQAR